MKWVETRLSPLLALQILCCCGYNWSSLNLPESHVPFFFTNNPDVKEQCRIDEECPYKAALELKRCWGYEKKCPKGYRMSHPECPDDSRGWASTKEDQLDQFWKGADFGYILERQKEMKVFCVPKSEDDSSLECAKYARYCRAKNIYLDFRRTTFTQNENFKEDFLLEGEIGGHCELRKNLLKAEGEHKSPLQSWYAEVEHFSSLPFKPIDNESCDIIIDKPVMFMKLDAGVNMFHHYCDFINFYASLHLNNSFSTDVYMINWDTSHREYLDLYKETFEAFTRHHMIYLREYDNKRSERNYGDLFKETFDAFTQHPMKYLRDFDNKRVCLKDAIFPLLPRMRWGMFYNMPLIPGCYGSSLFQAFSAHLVHRLHIPQEGPLETKVRITLLARNTKYRNVMNQDELVSALKTVGEYDVRLVVYKFRTREDDMHRTEQKKSGETLDEKFSKFKFREMPFLEQVKVSHNSDVFIGMHGAGLTHMLYQPDWGSVIELFNCGDPNCYFDLARLRGLKYFTWEKMEKLTQEDEGHHPQLGAHQKFTNYAFDVVEFMRLVTKATEHVKSHPAFINARKLKYSSNENILKDEL